jgi:hypothetical protein
LWQFIYSSNGFGTKVFKNGFYSIDYGLHVWGLMTAKLV